MRTTSVVFASSAALAVAFAAAWSVVGASRGGCADGVRAGARSFERCGTGVVEMRLDVPGCRSDVMVGNDAIDRVRHPSPDICEGGLPDPLPLMRLDTAYEVIHRSESITLPR